ncbi:hypothetical protein FOZ62_013713, partial [Perkinsus olseni]
LAEVAKASAAALGGPRPMHDELSTVPGEVDFYKARGFINILAAVGKVEAPAVEAGGASVVGFLPPGVSCMHSHSVLEPESGEQLPLKTDSNQPAEVKVKLRWRVMLYITEVAELQLAAVTPDGAIPIALIIRFCLLGTHYELHAPLDEGGGDGRVAIHALRVFWILADDANSIQRWARATGAVQATLSLCYQASSPCKGDSAESLPAQREQTIAMCDL